MPDSEDRTRRVVDSAWASDVKPELDHVTSPINVRVTRAASGAIWSNLH
jgi:hypothetical protein